MRKRERNDEKDGDESNMRDKADKIGRRFALSDLPKNLSRADGILVLLKSIIIEISLENTPLSIE